MKPAKTLLEITVLMALTTQVNADNTGYYPANKKSASHQNDGNALVNKKDNLMAVKNQPQPPASQQETVELPPMTIVDDAEENKSYTAYSASTATKTDTPLMQTPVSVQVVPQAVLRDQQATRLQDAVKNVSGVQQTLGSGGQYEDFVIRGFGSGVDYSRFRNGIRLPAMTFDLANIEQVEVLKGPAAMLYGRIEPGGMVNVVTRKPQSTPYYSLQQQFGSYDLYRTNLDATGALNADGTLNYRFDLGYTTRNSFRDFVSQERVFVAPSLHWRATPDTDFNLGVEYSHEDPSRADTGLPAIGKRVANLPINRNYSQPDPFNNDTIESTLVDFNWSHKFNDNWKFTNGVVANLVEYNFRDTPVAYVQTNLEGVANPSVRRGLYFEDFNRDTYTAYFNLNGKFDTFGVKHNVLLGGDYYEQENKNQGFFGLNYAIQHNFADADAMKYFTFVDLNKPNYNQFPFTFNQLDNLRKNTPNDFGLFKSAWYGLYFQDQLSFFDDKLHILGGGRFDWARQSQGTSFNQNITMSTSKDDHFSPRVGILYQPWKWLSVYGNYVESFGINNVLSTGAPLPPELSEQFEAGVKTEWLDGRLTASLAYFNLTKNNIAKQIDTNRYETIGAARSQGIELDINGQLTDALSLVATYAYTDARITKDFALTFDDNGKITGSNNGNQGKRLPNVGEHSGSTWLKYAFQDSAMKGLSVGVGAFFASQRQGDSENSYQLPGYVRADTYAAYTMNVGKSRLTAQLNVNNVFDKRYYFAGQPYNTSKAFNMVADPLTFMGSLRLEY
ncbi:TonB-dependent siderophore receptor [Crenothrix polyspora]|uniref:Ferrichrysobactin receptor n=1 Tax=Crenothrix polyspora TaxID=360316 RepID=A0A1R4H1H7_9GAMM|nr:TonB-dependent siderophore receptor [Crenothrix polyspora]SJM90081.1 Ferrichrysobactin receptor [Crenothrix polyspora]